MRLDPLLRLAWRESRTVRRRLLLSMSTIALGVAALVAIDSFASNVRTSVRDNSRVLLGGDLALTAHTPLANGPATLLDSLVRAGADTAQITTFPSMAVSTRTGRTRLVEVRAASPHYPLVGRLTTDPPSAWPTLQTGPNAIVDRSLLAALDGHVGDTLTLGYARFVIAGSIRSVPGGAEIQATLGPRVFIPDRSLAGTQLLAFGSRAEYRTLIVLGPHATAPPQRWLGRTRDALERDHVRLQTPKDAESNLMDTIDTLSRFLSLAGLAAVLLGGVGVASGISAYVARKLDTAAVLRCLGATAQQVLVIYITQAIAMGLVGALLGAAAGVALQYLLPLAVHDLLPVDVTIAPVPAALATGIALGLWVALLCALRPLLILRRVAPLAALRRDVDPVARIAARSDRARVAVNATMAATLLAVTLLRSGTWRSGIVTGVGLAVVFGALWLLAQGLTRIAARSVRINWPYPVRQGLANLYRPANQTRAVILALGFGAFVIGALVLVQTNLLHRFSTIMQGARGNLLFFDVQQDQRAGVDSIIHAAGQTLLEATPIVTMRVAAINGVPPDSLHLDSLASGTPRRGRRGRTGAGRAPWAVRHEYRSTYRDTLVATEHVVAGRWLDRRAAARRTDSIGTVSLEAGVAKDLGVAVGDRITWNVQGVPITTRVTSLRNVNWARFEPNFFAVFPSGILESAPAQYVMLVHAADPPAVAALERAVVQRHPNVSSVDLTLIRETVDRTVQRAALAIRFLALFALAIGLPVLFSAVAATRRERMREGVLLKTLGATRRQVARIFLVEYAALGLFGGLAGITLASLGAWALLHFAFETTFALSLPAALIVAALTTGVAIVVGVIGTRDAYVAPPMATLREMA